MGDVLVVSSTNTDLVCRTSRLPRPGETVSGTEFSTFAGGKGANQAVAAARAGARVAFGGAVGDDRYGEERLADLQREDIDVSNVRVIPGVRSGVALIIVDDRGENQIVVVPGANGHVSIDSIEPIVSQGGYDVLSLNLEIPFDAVRAAVQANHGRARVVLNAAPFDKHVIELLDHIDVLICNEIEAGELVGSTVTLDSASAAAWRIRDMGCDTVVLTLGRNGAVWSAGSEVIHVPAPVVDVVDTTAAGDAFCGAFVAWLSDGESIPTAVRAGVAAGSLTVTRRGAQPSLPGRDEIDSMLQNLA